MGVGLRTVTAVPLETVLLGCVLSLVLALVWRRNDGAISAPGVLLASLIVCFFCIGVVRTEIYSWQFNSSILEQSVGTEITFTGTVVKEPDIREKSLLLYVENETDRILVSTDRFQNIAYGQEVVVTGVLKKPEVFTTDLGRTFDYPAYLKAKGVEYSVSFAEVETLDSTLGNILVSGLLRVKHAFMNRLETVLPEPQVGLAEGLLLGVKQALGSDVEEHFRRTGIIHIVVLSGYNVMLVVAFFLFVLSFFLSPRKRMIGGIIAITCFALLVGLSATVVRASIMAGLLLLAQGLGQQYHVMRALFFAGALMLLLNPYLLLYDIGFQLSFMATLGLLFFTPHFESTIATQGSKIKITDFFWATLATQIAVLPLLLFHIGEVSLIAVVVNVLVLPVVPIVMLMTFITGIIAFVSLPLASVVGFATNVLLGYILFVARWFAELPFAAVSVPEFSAWGVLFMYGALGIIVWRLKKPKVHNEFADWVIEEEKTSSSFSFEKDDDVEGNTLPKIFR